MMTTELRCTCGALRLELSGAPIVVAECHCASCRDARRRMATLPGAPAVVGAHGGTHFVLYRKDRIRITAGRDRLRHFRLGPQAETRRVITSCCTMPVLLEFKGGHWASLYGNLWPAEALPAIDLHTMISDRGAAAPPLADGVPAGRWATAKFFAALLAAWIAMGFRAPPLALDTPEIPIAG